MYKPAGSVGVVCEQTGAGVRGAGEESGCACGFEQLGESREAPWTLQRVGEGASGRSVAGVCGDGNIKRDEGVTIGEAGGGDFIPNSVDALWCEGDDAPFRCDADRHRSRVAGSKDAVAVVVGVHAVGACGQCGY